MTPAPGGAFLARLDAVQQRLSPYGSARPAGGLTDPDPPTGERWDWGQVWAHLAEFVPYWGTEVERILGLPASEDPVPFGRVKSDPHRVEAIETDRDVPPDELLARLVTQLDELRMLLRRMDESDWARRGLHSTLGEMGMPRIVEEFLVGHLEAHAHQLDGLAGAD